MGYASEDWSNYLKRMTGRPGWSVARLARESGIHRGTIFKWMAGTRGITVANVRVIATALGDDVANALRAASGCVETGFPPVPDPRADPVIQEILNDPTLTDDDREELVRMQVERIEQDLARRRADFEMLRRRLRQDPDAS